MDKARVQSLTQAAPAWCDWEVVRAGGVRKRGMGKKGRSLAGDVKRLYFRERKLQRAAAEHAA
jgi:hypothetical protein